VNARFVLNRVKHQKKVRIVANCLWFKGDLKTGVRIFMPIPIEMQIIADAHEMVT
jgi:hypothetical protein